MKPTRQEETIVVLMLERGWADSSDIRRAYRTVKPLTVIRRLVGARVALLLGYGILRPTFTPQAKSYIVGSGSAALKRAWNAKAPPELRVLT